MDSIYRLTCYGEQEVEQGTSEWCYAQRDKALAEERWKDADVYLNLALLWKDRENKNGSN